VADKVINWSRLGGRQRAELHVKAAFGADPRRVIELLIGSAVGHPSVVRDPAPVAFFKGYAEAALDFTLVYWVMHYKMYLAVSSEVALRVADAFEEAGVNLAFPQHHLHVKSVDDSIRAMLGGGLLPPTEQQPDGIHGSDPVPKSNNHDCALARPATAPEAGVDAAER
jgi:small-conductance mechanosensitive channel